MCDVVHCVCCQWRVVAGRARLPRERLRLVGRALLPRGRLGRKGPRGVPRGAPARERQRFLSQARLQGERLRLERVSGRGPVRHQPDWAGRALLLWEGPGRERWRFLLKGLGLVLRAPGMSRPLKSASMVSSALSSRN